MTSARTRVSPNARWVGRDSAVMITTRTGTVVAVFALATTLIAVAPANADPAHAAPAAATAESATLPYVAQDAGSADDGSLENQIVQDGLVLSASLGVSAGLAIGAGIAGGRSSFRGSGTADLSQLPRIEIDGSRPRCRNGIGGGRMSTRCQQT